jgi:hypothetical protein
MANERGSFVPRAFSFVMRLLVSLVLPAWGIAMIALGVRSAAGMVDLRPVLLCWRSAPFSLPAVR